MDEETQEVWAKRVERWARSGLSVEESAAQQGVRPSSLKWWRWRLGASEPKRRRRRADPDAETKNTSLVKRRAEVSPITLVELGASVDEGIEVVLVSGVRIRVRRDFDAGTLTRLLDLFEAR